MISNVLSIAGSDPSGGAGIQADLKTFAAHNVYGMAVITALTAQNTQGVRSFQPVEAAFVRAQIESVFEDVDVHGVKIGMLANAEIIHVVADCLRTFKPPHVVLDPVMVATSGGPLIDEMAVETMRDVLFPLASLLTPNGPEAKILSDDLLALDVGAILLKGGHNTHEAKAVDVLLHEGREILFEAPWVDTKNTHGTGCTLSSAIAANLAKGLTLKVAVKYAKSYVTKALQEADALSVGCGVGPLLHNIGGAGNV